MVTALKYAWAQVRDWAPYVLPAVSNLILVLLGVVMSLPNLAERVEKNPRLRKLFAAICIAAGLVGFGFDVSERRTNDQSNKQLVAAVQTEVGNTNELVKDTKGLVSSTQSTLLGLDLLQTKMTSLNHRLANLDQKIGVAKKQNDQNLIAALQAQKRTSLSTLITMAPAIISQMEFWARKWDTDDRVIWKQLMLLDPSRPDGPEVDQKRKLLLQRRVSEDDEYTKQVLPLITSANYMREEFLWTLSNYEQTKDDNKVAAIFSKTLAGQPMGWGEMRAITNYMEGLTKRVAPAP